jgi:DnaJ-class molecular chaperone
MKLKPGEYKCDRCNGTGEIELINPDSFIGVYYEWCPKCKGEGKLDWIENVVGKKPKNDIFNGVTWMAPSGTAPNNPSCGQAYINTNNNEAYVYDGNTWVQVVSMNTPM